MINVKFLLTSFLLCFFVCSSTGFAQTSARGYYEQCLRFELAGDFLTAKQSCLNALEKDATLADASLALARIEFRLGQSGSAESRLRTLERQGTNPEVKLLLATIMLKTQRTNEAQAALNDADRQLRQNPNQQLEAQYQFLKGQLEETLGHFSSALSHYQQATILDSINPSYPLAKANLHFRLGDLNASQQEIRNYQNLTSDNRNPEMLSLLAKTLWAQSRLTEAATTFESAINYRHSRESNKQSEDLISLALTYYGQGNTTAGNLAFRDALRRGISLLDLLSGIIPWFILFVLGVGLHLWGESQIVSKNGLEAIEDPEMWRINHVYSIFFSALFAGLVLAFIFSLMRYNNFLAFVTPLQKTEVHAVFIVTFVIAACSLSFWRVRKNGWVAFEKLLGTSESAMTGFIVGLVLLVASIAYLKYLPDSGWFGEYYLSFYRLTPLLLAAALVLPFSQIFFSAFLIPSLEKRYNANLALLISATLFALFLAQPLLLLLAVGVITAEVFRRTQSGLNSVLIHLIINLGLVLGASFLPFVRNLFL